MFPNDLTTPTKDETSVAAHIQQKQETYNEDWSTVACSCVQYVLSRGVDIPNVNASDIHPLSDTPRPGGTAIMYYPHSGMSHVAYIEEVGVGWIRVSESNYEHCKITHRTLTLPHNRIVGYR